VPEFTIKVPGTEGKGEKGGPILLSARPVTSAGDNTDGHFSPDGTRILYLSRKRHSHRQAQIYELHLAPMIEKRITFHDGDDSSPSYYPDGDKILYASATDELKEEPAFIDGLMKAYDPKTYEPEGTKKNSEQKPDDSAKKPSGPTLGPSELYAQTLDGREIERLTNVRGYDGEPSVDAKGRRILFTSARRGKPSLFMIEARGVLHLTDEDGYDSGARFAPDGKAACWSRYSKDLSSAQIMVTESSFRKARALTPAAGTAALDLHPSWNPAGDAIVFSSNRGGARFNLYSIDRKGTCLKRLTESDSDEIQPSISPDGKWLLFTGNASGQNQLYVIAYQPPEGCLPAAETPASTTK